MRRRTHLTRCRALPCAFLSGRDALRGLRRRSGVVLSLGGADARAAGFRFAGNGDLHRRPCHRLRLRLEEGRLRMAVSPGQFMLARLDDVARWAQSSSVWPLTMGLACCAIEMMSVTAPEYDIARLGSEVFRSSPRQADLMIVSGRVAQKMGPVVKRLYDQMADPKWVISMGACASSGGIFDNYAVIQGIDTIVPVDVYVPGCPPTPDGLLYAVNLIQQQIREGGRGGILARA
ncbi:MAG: NADH-quinone oxidoreductase subunit B [Candidatus Eremiobacteraeota bacterium]|nr:NADH-quinone oxidoreductase subunit B [Candidatus Eremiobacteraeota bacterium]